MVNNGEYRNPFSGFFGVADNAFLCRAPPPLFYSFILIELNDHLRLNPYPLGRKIKPQNPLRLWKGSSLGFLHPENI
jgi:hypothetical protein